MHILNADAAYNSIVSILVSDHSVKKSRISINSQIPTQLGVDGADAWELIRAIQETWHVDLQLDIYSHFGPESGLFQQNPPDPMTVGQLVNFIMAAHSKKSANKR